jgi:hypothetical protein
MITFIALAVAGSSHNLAAAVLAPDLEIAGYVSSKDSTYSLIDSECSGKIFVAESYLGQTINSAEI